MSKARLFRVMGSVDPTEARTWRMNVTEFVLCNHIGVACAAVMAKHPTITIHSATSLTGDVEAIDARVNSETEEPQ